MNIGILGCGAVGSSTAFSLATSDVSCDLNLIDIDEDTATGHAIDIRQARTIRHIHAIRDSDEPQGEIRVLPSTEESLAHLDLLIVTATVPPPEGAKTRGGRRKYLEKNYDLAETVGAMLADNDPFPVIVASNPLDPMTYFIWQQSGWPRERFLGYSLSEKSRIKNRLAVEFGCDPSEVNCPILGEHGENIVPLFSKLQISGTPKTLDPDVQYEVTDDVCEIPYKVVELRGKRDSSRWVTGYGLAHLAKSVIQERATDPIPLSVPLMGEYGFSDVSMSVPVTIDADGWSQIVKWDLTEAEEEALEQAYQSISEDCQIVQE